MTGKKAALYSRPDSQEPITWEGSTNQPVTLNHHPFTPFAQAGPHSHNQPVTHHSVTHRGKKTTHMTKGHNNWIMESK